MLFWTAILMLTLAFQYAAAASPGSALAVEGCDSYAVWTTDVNGDAVNQNHYASKPEVYLNGGPDKGPGLTPGTRLYYQVREPDGTPLMEIRSVVSSADGNFHVQLYPYDTTSNHGNEYKVVVSTEADLSEGGCTKSDNFKVAGPGSLKITKSVEGGPTNVSGDFDIHVDCGAAGSFNRTISFPDPGFVIITGIDAKAHCTVSETDTPNAPSGYAWGDATFSGNPATIESGKTVTVGVHNHLNLIPAPALMVEKGVSLSASGPFEASLTTTVGTTVYYRITVTNTGNVTLHGISLTDDKTTLTCTIPGSLAVDAHFDCDYSTTAVAGETKNTATADSDETGSEEDSATVTANPVPAPALTVDKGVSLSADGPFEASVTTTTGTTVYYRITITNTGNTNLTGVTLSDNTFDLAAKGCTIPTTLAVGAHFDCDYSDVATTGTKTNIATGDSAETDSDTGTATVTAAPAPAPAFTVDKGVSLSATGPFEASLTTTTGTTVYYRITISNTGNVILHGVTLSDNTFDLVAKGCTIPTTLAVGAHFDCDYSTFAVTGTTTNIATGDTDETGPDTGTASVTAAPAAGPALNVEKSVALSATGPWGDSVNVQTGTTVFFKITVTNTGNTDLTAVTLTDDTFDLVAKGCTIPTTLAIGAHFDCAYSSVAVTGTTTNTATADSEETGSDTDTATVVATVTPPPAGLTIEKTNNAPLVNVGGTNLPTAAEGSTVTFTLTYTHTGAASTDGTITDVLPVGLTYVSGSATNSADFTFSGYDSGTRTLTWTASAGVSASGSVTYQAKVDAGAADLDQPLENLATIASSDTESDTDTSEVFVPAPVLGETDNSGGGVPTAPQTDVLDSSGPAAPGLNMGLVLVFLGLVTLALAFVTPVPAALRDRSRRR